MIMSMSIWSKRKLSQFSCIGPPTSFFRPSRRIRQRFHLSPFPFLLVADALSRLILHAKNCKRIEGVKVSSTEEITHTLFIDDILIFGSGTKVNMIAFKSLIDLYQRAMGMMINIEKTVLSHNEFPEDLVNDTK